MKHQEASHSPFLKQPLSSERDAFQRLIFAADDAGVMVSILPNCK